MPDPISTPPTNGHPPLPAEIAEGWASPPSAPLPPDPSRQASWWASFLLAFFFGPLGLWHGLRSLPQPRQMHATLLASAFWAIALALVFSLQQSFLIQRTSIALPLFFANLFALIWLLAWKLAPALPPPQRALYWVGQILHFLALSFWPPLILRIMRPSSEAGPWLAWIALAFGWMALWRFLPPPPAILPKRPQVALFLAWAFAFGTLVIAWSFWTLGSLSLPPPSRS